VLTLPSGRRVRGRGLRHEAAGGALPEFGLYLLARDPRPMGWPARWARWRDFGLPADRAAVTAALVDVWHRSAGQRVEVACHGGLGRTGTALACLAVLDGLPPRDAIRLVRRDYDRRAVETPWQRWFVGRFARDHG
jgi:protein-tyrosine phosphatase